MPYTDLSAPVDVYTVLLLHMDGADAATSFIDETGKVMTAVGNAQIDTAQSVFNGASGLFDGTGDYVTTPDSADWILDAGSDSNAWTVDFRLRFNGDPGTGIQGIFHHRTDNTNFMGFYLNNNALVFQIQSASVNIILISNAWNPADATWYHVAIVKNGATGYLAFVDGTQVGSTQTDTSLFPNFTGVFEVGRYVDGGGTARALNGWIDEFRVSKGVARWTGNFTPPTNAY